jgi:hypothetical protein
MNRISNIDKIPKEYMYDPDFRSKMKTILIGDAIGDDHLKDWTSDPNQE